MFGGILRTLNDASRFRDNRSNFGCIQDVIVIITFNFSFTRASSIYFRQFLLTRLHFEGSYFR